MTSWEFTVMALAGEPLPPAPVLPGRVHTLAIDEDLAALPADEQEAVLLSDVTDAEAGLALGVSRQRINQLRQALRGRAE